MKRLLTALMALILLTGLTPALAADFPLPEGCVELAEGQALDIDLDGDGAPETVSWAMAPGEFDDNLMLTVAPAAGEATVYPTDILWSGAVYICDLDGDGLREILLTGDLMSADYCTWCLHYRDGQLTELLFPDSSRGDNDGDYYKSGYGLVTFIGETTITLTGSQDVLGTWMADRMVALQPTGRFEFCDNGLWERSALDADDDLWEYGALTVSSPVAYVGSHGWESGLLSPGTRLLVYASDKQSEALFVTQDDLTGVFSISPNYEQGWGWLVDGMPEEDCFEYVPYAD